MKSRIQLLDCTLRDGGYLNDWCFGYDNIRYIFSNLVTAGIELIEIGFLDGRRSFDRDKTIQPNTESFGEIFSGIDKGDSKVVAMIDYGTCDIDNIQNCQETFIDAIRIIFKKPKMYEACDYAQILINKGYDVYLQMVSITSYSDRDMLDLIDRVNAINPCAVSLVDTYGLLHDGKITHYYELLDYNLNPNITVGYHGHNNFQLAYANCVSVAENSSTRPLVLDGTCYGLGKSAGNAPLELLITYLNKRFEKAYRLEYILEIIDVVVLKLSQELKYGYSLKYFVAAANDCHPNYVKYLMQKKTLSMRAINKILANIEEERKLNFATDYIEVLYQRYQMNIRDAIESIHQWSDELGNRQILLLGPGATALTECDRISKFIQDINPIVISINCTIEHLPLQYLFISNAKRYGMLFSKIETLYEKGIKTVATSNITYVNRAFDYVANYSKYMDTNELIEDNALVMMLHILNDLGKTSIFLAGFDGFSETKRNNYFNEHLELYTDTERLISVNHALKERIEELGKQIDIQFVTTSLYDSNAKV